MAKLRMVRGAGGREVWEVIGRQSWERMGGMLATPIHRFAFV